MGQTQSSYKFPFQKTFKWKSNMTIEELPRPFANKSRTLQLSGVMTVEFTSSPYDGIANLRIVDEKVTVSPATLPMGKTIEFISDVFSLPLLSFSFTSNPDDGGSIDLSTGDFTYRSKVSISASTLPVLKQIGMKDINVVVRQFGKMDLEKEVLRSYGDFLVTPLDDLEKDRILVRGRNNKGCETSIKAYGTVIGEPSQDIHTTYICPGENVTLWWSSSEDVTSVTIVPDVGVVPANGHIVVSPATTTTYRITASGECESHTDVTVYVIIGEEVINVSAPYSDERRTFHMRWLNQFTSPNIRVSQIRSVCASGCYMHPVQLIPYEGYDACNGTICNMYWFGSKTEWDGTISGFSVNRVLLPLAAHPLPLVGDWDFLPEHFPADYHRTSTKGVGFFQLLASCRS